MAKVKTTVVMYQHTYYDDIISEEEYQEMLNKRIEACDHSESEFDDWLGAKYTAIDIFKMDEKEKARVKDLYHQVNVEYVQSELADEWERIETTVYVDFDKQLKNECNCGCPCCG
jgi:hypothetical protein